VKFSEDAKLIGAGKMESLAVAVVSQTVVHLSGVAMFSGQATKESSIALVVISEM
jgi:hypothetical protein